MMGVKMSSTIFAPNRDALGSGGKKQSHCLCVDDHEDTRALISALLGMHGYEVTTVGSVTDALSLAKKAASICSYLTVYTLMDSASIYASRFADSILTLRFYS
jgi:CheY-like chemotaxis protein